MRCSRCQNPEYLLCSVDCQRCDWKRHKQECGSLKTELLGTGQAGIIPNLCEKPNDELVTRIKGNPPRADLLHKAREAFGSRADLCFLEDLARLARVCQHLVRTYGGSTKVMIDVGAEPNATLDPFVLSLVKTKTEVTSPKVVNFFVHRIGRRERYKKESVLMVERIIKFIQSATEKDRKGQKLQVFLLSAGGHDSDCVVKEIFDKPHCVRDLISARCYNLLGGNASHYAATCVPWAVIGQEGFYCVACEQKGCFCGLDATHRSS